MVLKLILQTNLVPNLLVPNIDGPIMEPFNRTVILYANVVLSYTAFYYETTLLSYSIDQERHLGAINLKALPSHMNWI